MLGFLSCSRALRIHDLLLFLSYRECQPAIAPAPYAPS